MHDWQTTLLALCFLASTAAFFIVWSKYEEQKQKTAEEHNAYRNALEYGNAIAEALKEESSRRWDEISLRLNVEKELEQSKVHQQWMQEDVLRYSEQLTKEQALGAEREEEIFRLSAWHNIMQDKLSALLCPRNDHIWKDGFCVKCGRAKDALS